MKEHLGRKRKGQQTSAGVIQGKPACSPRFPALTVDVSAVWLRPVLVTTYWLLPPETFGTVIVPFLACIMRATE